MVKWVERDYFYLFVRCACPRPPAGCDCPYSGYDEQLHQRLVRVMNELGQARRENEELQAALDGQRRQTENERRGHRQALQGKDRDVEAHRQRAAAASQARERAETERTLARQESAQVRTALDRAEEANGRMQIDFEARLQAQNAEMKTDTEHNGLLQANNDRLIRDNTDMRARMAAMQAEINRLSAPAPGWDCPQCTLQNAAESARCDACDLARPDRRRLVSHDLPRFTPPHRPDVTEPYNPRGTAELPS